MNKKSKVYVLCPDSDVPTGGIKQLYRHVDVLNKNGFSAFILHERKGFRCTWFENNTKIVYIPKVFRSFNISPNRGKLGLIKENLRHMKRLFLKKENITEAAIDDDDYLVIPEVYGPDIANIWGKNKKVIFNQNAHYTFINYPLNKTYLKTPYMDERVIATLVVSEHNLNYLKYVFPEHNFVRIRYGFNPRIFYYYPHKKKQIAYMPRKLSEDAHQIINILKFRRVIEDFELVPIQNKSEREVAKILQDSLIFLSFSNREGCPMPPLEAMACGCIVIGYDGGGGREYFKKEFCYPVDCGDIIAFSKTVELVIKEYNENEDNLLEKSRKASEYVLKEYSLEREEQDIVNFWSTIIKT